MRFALQLALRLRIRAVVEVAVWREEVLDCLEVKKLYFNAHGVDVLAVICATYIDMSIKIRSEGVVWGVLVRFRHSVPSVFSFRKPLGCFDRQGELLCPHWPLRS